jgi:molybdopterin/thiamine biosynthesis adenylyltransferase/rhodanese-related sulfurtransferase
MTKAEQQQPANLTRSELMRYSRHLILPEVGVTGQQRIKSASILIVGAGGLGSPCALYLAAAGVGRLGLVDFDPVDLSNLQRQILYTVEDIGKSKVITAQKRLQGLNNEISIEAHSEKLNASNAEQIIGQYDIVIDGTDNFSTRYLINDACVLLHKPNVYGSIFRFEGQLSLFDPPHGPCYRCLFPQAPPAEAVPNCAEGGVLGVLAGTIGVLQATEALKYVLGIGQSLRGKLVLYDALDMRFDTLKIKRDTNCPVCGESPSIRELHDEAFYCATSSTDNQADNSPNRSQETTLSAADETEIEPDALAAYIKAPSNGLVLLDVRTVEEFAICSLPGAMLIPVNELESRISELDKQNEIVVYCKSGARSRRAASLLRMRGFTNVRHLIGGIIRWAEDVDPSMPMY